MFTIVTEAEFQKIERAVSGGGGQFSFANLGGENLTVYSDQ